MYTVFNPTVQIEFYAKWNSGKLKFPQHSIISGFDIWNSDVTQNSSTDAIKYAMSQKKKSKS